MSEVAQLITYNLNYNDSTGQGKEISIKNGDVLFVLGANGSGKSGLMTKLFSQNQAKSKRISAHRQTWFTSNTLDFTPTAKYQTENNMRSTDAQIHSRYRDDYHQQRSQVTIYNLINAENLLGRKVLKLLRTDIETAKKIGEEKTPLEKLNQLLAVANLPIVISVEQDERIFASKNSGPQYSIAQLSDGERNAILIAADVLTATPNTLFIIDEPERHLHRSIISPLLTELFLFRKDCAFIVATHDIGMPIDNPESRTLIVRSCIWNGEQINSWDADLLSPNTEIDQHLKQDILGSRRTILFIEGTGTSLDQHIYRILFPDISIVSQGNCLAVEQAVKGILATESFSWIKAYGLIDADDRLPDELEKFKTQNIYALSCYSVESLYYNSTIIKCLANVMAELLGIKSDVLENEVIDGFLKSIVVQKERLCARVSERKIRGSVRIPIWKEIQSEAVFKQEIDLKKVFENEKILFDSYIESKEIDKLIFRYPVRETQVLNEIASTLRLKTRKDYESSVRKLLMDDVSLRNQIRLLLGDLAQKLAIT